MCEFGLCSETAEFGLPTFFKMALNVTIFYLISEELSTFLKTKPN